VTEPGKPNRASGPYLRYACRAAGDRLLALADEVIE
jgi:hypothetical protein